MNVNEFDGPDILSRYLYLYHTQQSQIGEATKYLYGVALNSIQNSRNQSTISRQDFLFSQSFIDESVKITHDKLGGFTAGCGPAQRSFPLPLCSWIDDHDVFDLSLKEAALTHYSPLAGQVAGFVNVICRALLKKESWHAAVHSAFCIPQLHPDIVQIAGRYARSPHPLKKIHMAYAPTVLNGALYYVNNWHNPRDAINAARANDPYYCAPIVGILSGVRWGISQDMYASKVNDAQFITIRDRATKLSSQWPSQHDAVAN